MTVTPNNGSKFIRDSCVRLPQMMGTRVDRAGIVVRGGFYCSSPVLPDGYFGELAHILSATGIKGSIAGR